MLNRSAAFDAAVVAGCPAVVSAEIYQNGVATLKLNLQPGAKVTLNEKNPARRTFTGQVADSGGLTPLLPTDPLSPYGPELVVDCGVVLPNGTVELVPAGVFRLTISKGSTAGVIDLQGIDRSMVVAHALNEAPYTILPLTPLDIAIGNYLNTKYPALPFTADPLARLHILPPTPTVYLDGTQSGDPWKNMMDLAANYGRELYIDATGTAILREIPQPITDPIVWDYSPGPSNLAINAGRTTDTTGIHNVWIVQAQGTGTAVPVSYSIEINDPSSPIFPDPNNFGRRPLVTTSAQVATVAQAQQMAIGIATKGAGASEVLTFNSVPHPAHEPGDVVRFASTLLGVDLPVVLSSWDLQLDMLTPVTYVTRQVPPWSARALGYWTLEDNVLGVLNSTSKLF